MHLPSNLHSFVTNITSRVEASSPILLSVVVMAAVGLALSPVVQADHTPDPATVTAVGSLQDELGCPGDWQPDCAATYLGFDAEDGVWQNVFNIPAGAFEYKAALNDAWDENYGANAQQDGPNISITLGAATDVKFYYDHESHWITDNVNSVIATVVGSFQGELGCSGDWQPWCLQSWLQDPNGDGTYVFTTADLPAGSYECKVAHDEDWAESYPASNVPFTIPNTGDEVRFEYDPITHALDIQVSGPPPSGAASVTIAGDLQSEVGCPGDWQPDCAVTHLSFDADDDVWQGVFNVPAGMWQYKAAIDDSWFENYGANAQRDGPNIPLNLGGVADVKFYYDEKSHWITDNVNSVIASVAGSFQDEIGCSGDWQPDCLRSWLQDPDGDGIYVFETYDIPAGSYECKVAHDEAWTESYPPSNLPFAVATNGDRVIFSYDPGTHVLTIEADGLPVDADVDSWGTLKSRYH